MKRSRLWLIGLLALAGCNAVLDIEDLPNESGDSGVSDDPGKDGGGRGGNGSSGQGGSAGKGGDGAAGKDGGTAGGSGGSGGSGASGSGAGGMDADVPDDSGTDSGADTGTPDSGEPDTGTPPSTEVHGKVIDYFRNPVKDVAVKIGSVTATTDANGEFTVADVSATYNVALTVTAQHYGGNEVAGWLFVGLTRRDPTLQVYRGNPLVSGDILITVNNTTFPLGSYENIELAYAGDFGDTTYGLSSMAVNTSLSWEGPNSVSGTAHALRWTDADTSPHVPVTYHAADEHALSMSTTVDSTLTFDLGGSSPLPTGVMAGSVTAPSFAQRTNAMFVRYTDGAAIQVVDDYAGTDTFSYVAPNLQNSAIVVAATVNTSGYAPFAVAYSDDLTPGTSGISLTVPSPATPLGPGGNTSNVTSDTLFTWTGSDQVYVFHVDNDNYLEGYYVVTAAKEARIPAPPLTNLPLAANSPYTWTVSTHITHATVDEATGPEGFLDAYCTGELSGPQRGHGTHTLSTGLGFTTQ